VVPFPLLTAWPRQPSGTDTGGSLRIPSGLNGCGFKPTQSRVSRDGVMPLSTSFDSAGPIGWTVEDCALLDSIIADRKLDPSAPLTAKKLRLAVRKPISRMSSLRTSRRHSLPRCQNSRRGRQDFELPMTIRDDPHHQSKRHDHRL